MTGRYFSDLDLSGANDFQREAAARFVEFFERLHLGAIKPERTRSRWTDRGKMLSLIVENPALPRFDLMIVLERPNTIVVNLGPEHQHFGYGYEEDEIGSSILDAALHFVDAVLDGRVVMEFHRRGSIPMKTVLTARDRSGEIFLRSSGSTFIALFGLLLVPFVRKTIETVVIRFA